MSFKQAILSCLLAGFVSVLHGHDMWLVPEKSTIANGETVVVDVAVGMDFPTSLNAIAKDRLTLVATNGTQTVNQFDFREDTVNKNASISFKPTESGVWLVGCVTRPNRIELEAGKFNDYLLHDGLPHILANRMDRDELANDAIEQYSKYTKTLVAVGNDLAAVQWLQAARPMGHRLEIVPLENLSQKRNGDTLKVRVLFEKQPLAGANLCWDHPGNGEKFTGQTWTDSEGTAVVPLSKNGLMTLRLVHMTRPKTPSHEWESFWSSFTFTVPGD